ncbi:hypothetical protein SAMN04488558_106110 [Ignavigranum ruoffiae]|uniref:Uncharacterized protein n=1 Tax=Ignavigranum ruoffiae TaxID=89093 RepID=A0A1H9E6C7_9LACT|nr:hypothetical protein [Ignavigranum ruoffiae]SEQ21177.1 hypothetical protein SAMN04488558_106110 [Ignavigranum ruoffiae]
MMKKHKFLKGLGLIMVMVAVFISANTKVSGQTISADSLEQPLTFISHVVTRPSEIYLDPQANEIIFRSQDDEISQRLVSIQAQNEQEIKLKSAYCSRVKVIKVSQQIEWNPTEDSNFPEAQAFLFKSREDRLSIAIRLDPETDIYTEYILK